MAAERFPTARADMPDISADLISGRRFAQTWRGYDPEEVKEFLAQVAEQVRTLRERVDIEVSARREAEQRAMHPRIDEATLMSAVGEETAAILRSARTAAAEIIAKAEANAESLVTAAESKSTDLLAHSEALSTRRAEESEVAANELWTKALADADELRQSAQQDAAAIVQEAAQKGQESIEAAEVVREKILTDLTRRRKLATVQIEQLRAGRERLLDAYLVVRRTLDEVTGELQRADAEARAAAVAVGRMDRDEQTGELVDLRREDHWDSLAAFGSGEVPGQPGDQKTTAETPVVLAPKVAQVASTPAVVTAPPAVVPAPPPVVGGGPAIVTTPAVVGSAQAVITAPPPKVAPDTAITEDSTSLVSQADAIESVRIVRTEPDNTGGVTIAAPEVVVRPKAAVMTEDEPGPAVGEDQAETEESQGKDVQGLFARLRENRDQATRAARKTLSETDDEQTAGTSSGLVEAKQNGVGQALVDETGSGAKDKAATNGGAVVASTATVSAATANDAPVSAPPGSKTPASKTPASKAPGSEVGASGAASPVAGDGGASSSAPATDLDAGARLLERGDAVTRDLGSSLARKLKRALQDEQNSLLDRLRSLKGTATPANILPDPDEHPDHFADAGRPLLQQAAQAGAQVASEICGNEAPKGAVSEHVDDLAEELGRAIAEPLRQRLELAIRSASDDPAALADALGAAYREWKTQRIEAAAHHEVAAAFSRGAYLTFPDGAFLRWVVSTTEGPCPDCEDNALAGDQPKGEPWPTGQLYPPAHPGCRCALAPASSDDTGPSTTSPPA